MRARDVAAVTVAGVTALLASGAFSASPCAQAATTNASRVAFDVASIKVNASTSPGGGMAARPGGLFTVTNITLRDMIGSALVRAKSDGGLGPQLRPSTVDCLALSTARRESPATAPPLPGICGMRFGTDVLVVDHAERPTED